jgi:hypothetical protein
VSTDDGSATVSRRLRENGPGVLVPLAWTFVTAAHLDLVGTRPVLIAHLVMDVLLAAFAVTSYRDMQSGVLRAWLWVIVLGFGVTLVGTASFFVDGQVSTAMQTATVAGWMLLPGVALVYTGVETPDGGAGWVYTAGGLGSLAGLVVYLAGVSVVETALALPVGLTLTNLGQTAGILNAVAAD